MKVPADASYQLLAARYVRKQLKQLTGQLDGVRQGEDAEFIHRARVASRRLRAALGMFDGCFGRKKTKLWRKEIRRLTTNLGEARDKDVQIEFVCDVLSGLQQTTHYPGIARLLVKLEHQREELQPKVLKTVQRLHASPIAGEMRAATKSLVCELGKRGVVIQNEFVFRQTEKHILSRMDDMLGYQDCLADAEDQDGHHAMRIAAKRLRYTMEICKPVYNSHLDEFIATVKEVQGLLGDIHDCDVWVENLQELLEEERLRIVRYFRHSGPLARLQTGIDYLRSERRERRQQLFEKLVQYWDEMGRMGLWDELVSAVRSRDTTSDYRETAAGAPDRSAEHRPVWHKPAAEAARSKPRTVLPRPASFTERSLEEAN